MKLIIYPFFVFCLFFFGCNSKACKLNEDKIAKQLNDSAVVMGLLGDTTKVIAAIDLLNEAVNIQPDYYLAHWNKLIFQYQIGLIDDVFSTLKVMEQLTPNNPDLKMMFGFIYEQFKLDTIQAMVKYNEADLLYRSILDTLNSNSSSYQSVIVNYALNLKMLGKDIEADNTLSLFIQSYYNNKEEYETFKQYIETYIIGKTREEVIRMTPSDFHNN